MSVAVEGDGDGRVAEALLDGLGVSAFRDQQGGTRMAQVMETQPVQLRRQRASDGRLELTGVEVAVPQRPPVG